MASGRGAALSLSLIKYLLGNNSIAAAPAGLYLALFSNIPTADNGTFTELSGSGYARVTISATNDDTAWSATTTDSTGVWRTNANQLVFNAVAGTWTFNGAGMYDASTGGSLVYWGALAAPVFVGTGVQVTVNSGGMRVTEG